MRLAWKIERVIHQASCCAVRARAVATLPPISHPWQVQEWESFVALSAMQRAACSSLLTERVAEQVTCAALRGWTSWTLLLRRWTAWSEVTWRHATWLSTWRSHRSSWLSTWRSHWSPLWIHRLTTWRSHRPSWLSSWRTCRSLWHRLTWRARGSLWHRLIWVWSWLIPPKMHEKRQWTLLRYIRWLIGSSLSC